MFFGIGTVVVLVCVFGGFAVHGDLAVLWQPIEVVIIFGAAAGAFIIANPTPVIKSTLSGIGSILKGSKYNKESYVELLCLQYAVFKMIKSKGALAIEAHVENPHESSLFSQFPKFSADHHAVEFFCDYLRLITLGTEDPNEMDDLMNEELDVHHEEAERAPAAIQNIADGMPALGIVAAVLGVITTMGSLTEPPEVLGKLIGAALVGTFLGVLMSYGFIAPMSQSLKAVVDAEAKYFKCIKAGLLAHLHGYPPAVSVEFARKALLSDVRPSFYEVEEATSNLSLAA